MATPLTPDRLLSALRAEGVSVVEVGGWRTHNRGQRGTGWGPVNGVMIHHTVSTGTEATVRMCRDGYTGLPGPLCHGVADKDGRIHLVGYGRANHAGGGDPAVLAAVIREQTSLPAPVSTAQDGNSRFYGIEAVNLGDGYDPWPTAQREGIARAAAGICRAHGWNQHSVIGHAEWQPGKVDPRGPGKNAAAMMRDFRARIGVLLSSPAGGGSAVAYVVQAGDTLSAIARRYPGVTWQQIANTNALGPPYLIRPGDQLRIPAARTHTVRPGDTLSAIAAGYPGVTWQQIATTNRIPAPYLIRPGDVLTIPTPQ